MNDHSNDHIVEQCAVLMYETHRKYLQEKGENPPPHWLKAPEGIRKNTRENIQIMLSSSLSAEEFHAHMLQLKFDRDWTYGPAYSLENKTHPSMVPWDEMSESHRNLQMFVFAMVQTTASFLDVP